MTLKVKLLHLLQFISDLKCTIVFRDMATSIVEEYKWIVMDGTADPAWIGKLQQLIGRYPF